jgi:hypothetical protein
MSTNLKLNNTDLADIFSTTTGNTSYQQYYSTLNSLDIGSSSSYTIGTESVGYSINGNDIVTIFQPKYYDCTDNNTSTTITIPSWCNKIGFLLQASGGAGGADFTDYWQKYHIPQVNYTQTSYTSTYYLEAFNHRNYRGFYRWNQVKTCFTCDRSYFAAAIYNTSTTYGGYNTTTYYRNAVQSKEYNGSGGGGGGCCAGLYTIDPNNRLAEFIFNTNDSLGYKQIYFDSNNYASSFNGGNVTANSNTGSETSPEMMYNSNATNDSTDTAGTGSNSTIVTDGKITQTITSSGSNGDTTTGTSTIPAGGDGGLANDQTIGNYYVPTFSDNYGKGNNGSDNSTATAEPNNHILRYWFIR